MANLGAGRGKVSVSESRGPDKLATLQWEIPHPGIFEQHKLTLMVKKARKFNGKERRVDLGRVGGG